MYHYLHKKTIIMASRTSGRITLPQNAKDNLELAQKLFIKHQELGTASPLNQLDGINLTDIISKIAPTIEAHNAAEEHKRKMEQNYLERDTQLPQIKSTVRKCIALLKATYATNPKKLSDWGVVVDDSKPSSKSNKTNTITKE